MTLSEFILVTIKDLLIIQKHLILSNGKLGFGTLFGSLFNIQSEYSTIDRVHDCLHNSTRNCASMDW